jgi:mitogen-activated protein kinase kinase kinase
MLAGATISTIPPPPPPSEQMSATYIPQGDTYGEGVGIPGFAFEDSNMHAHYAALASQPSWPTMSQSSLDTAATTPMDEAMNRDKLYLSAMQGGGGRGISNASSASPSATTIPPELAAQWPLDRIVAWLQVNGFSKDWQDALKLLNFQGAQFLEIGLRSGRGNLGIMHQQVYPALKHQYDSRGAVWDPPTVREEGKRMRRLIRLTLASRSDADMAKMGTSADADSPNVSILPSSPPPHLVRFRRFQLLTPCLL